MRRVRAGGAALAFGERFRWGEQSAGVGGRVPAVDGGGGCASIGFMIALMFRRSAAALAAVVAVSSGGAKELEGVYQPTPGPCPTVEEQMAKATLPPGYALRCFASEPMVINPVAMSWDHRGRLWVVELYEYPSGASNPNDYAKTATDEMFRPVIKTGAGSPRDRVIILEDSDNDGVADKRTVFVEGLSLATAIVCGHGGVFVGQAPNMFFFRDVDGDDVADEYKAVLTGFGLEDRHELLNSFTWGPDGLMYFTHGVFTHSRVRRPTDPEGEGFTLNAGIYRAAFGPARPGRPAPTVERHEVFSDGTSNPWGCDYDAAGNWFVEACVIDHLFHMAPGGLYARQGGAPENPYAYDLLPSIVPEDHPRHFRAAYAGIQVYQGGVYPDDTRGHLFFGNIHDNAIHEERVEPEGATFKAHVVRDFLRANDGWFRPVSIQTGPDGFLWVMDWCDKYPCYQNAQANPEGVDREKGRIWRVCYEPESRPVPAHWPSRPALDMDLTTVPPAVLLENLGSSNSWLVRNSRQTMIEQLMTGSGGDEPAARDELRTGLLRLARASGDGSSALEAVRILGSTEFCGGGLVAARGFFGEVLEERLGRAGGDGTFEVECLRALAAVAAADGAAGGSGAFLAGLAADGPFGRLADDRRAGVRAAVATWIRQAGAKNLTVNRDEEAHDFTPWQERLIKASAGGDRTLGFLIWQGIEPELALAPERYVPWLAALAPQTKPLSVGLTYKMMRRLCDTRKPESIDLALKFLDTVAGDGDLVATALDGLVKGQEAAAIKPTMATEAYFARWAAHEREDVRNFSQKLATFWGDANAIAALMAKALSETTSLEERISAIQTVRKLREERARAGMAALLEIKTPDALTIEVLRAAAELGGRHFPTLILRAWRLYPPALRATAAEVLTSRPEWASRLLDAVEGKGVTFGGFDPATLPVTVRRYFATAAPDEIKARAQSLLGTWNETGGDVKALITRKRAAALIGEPDLENGKAVFTATCATCHVFHGGGQAVGPELIGSGRSSLDALLNNIINPNQIIGNGYQNIVITTKDGRTLSGRMTEDTPTRVRVLGIGAREEVVARDQIETLQDTGVSLMPAGFGELPDEMMRDLVWYLLAPPEEGPLTPEKKAALAAPVTELAATAAAVPSEEGNDFPEDAARIDWESVSLWQPDWKVVAPEFEGTPRKLIDFEGRKNVLQLHPFPLQPERRPARLIRTLTVPADGEPTLTFECASHALGDWDLVVQINGEIVQKTVIAPADQRWHQQSVPLSRWRGQTIEISLENHASAWLYEFSYWAELTLR